MLRRPVRSRSREEKDAEAPFSTRTEVGQDDHDGEEALTSGEGRRKKSNITANVRRVGFAVLAVATVAAVLSLSGPREWGLSLPMTSPSQRQQQRRSEVEELSPQPLSVATANGGSQTESRGNNGDEQVDAPTLIATAALSKNGEGQDDVDDDDDEKDDTAKQNVTVFIGIKVGDPLGVRLEQIRRTWLRDALDERGSIKIRFFTTQDMIDRALDAEGTASESRRKLVHLSVSNIDQKKQFDPVTPAPLVEPPDGGGDFGTASSSSSSSLRYLLVPTGCRKGDLRCGTTAMFAYYLAHHSNYSFFCSFDDDQYVLIRNLLRVLESYSRDPPRYGRNIYVGNSPFVYNKDKNETLRWKGGPKFSTGGAGYCLSRDLVERGRSNFTALPAPYADDVAVGYVVQHALGVDLIEDRRFHSHLEFRLRQILPRFEVAKQVSFGYNLKAKRNYRMRTWPNIPFIFSEEEDPMRFRSLRCFLKANETETVLPECSHD